MEVDLSRLAEADLGLAQKVDEVLRHDFNQKVWRAAERQRRIAAFYALNRPMSRDGFGEQTLAVDPMIDALWRQYYGHDYTANKDLVKFLLRRNPEIKVQSRGTRIQVGWAAGEGSKKPVGVQVRSPKSEVRSTGTEVRSPKSEVRSAE